MRVVLPAIVLAASLSVLAGSACADPARKTTYKASDIVSHFAPPPDLGASRSLCIGTESECAKATAPVRPKAGNFDLVVNFEYNSVTLTRDAVSNLDEFASALKDERLAAKSFVVEGHTDGKGGDGFNLDLSTRRAQAVVEYLRSRGVNATRLEAKGLGKLKPIAADPLDPANRRVETRLRTE